MLCLTRRELESVNIGDDITVTVVSIKGKQIRLAFTAPESINIRRSELPKLTKQRKQAVGEAVKVETVAAA